MQFCGDGTISTATATIGLWLAAGCQPRGGRRARREILEAIDDQANTFFRNQVQPNPEGAVPQVSRRWT